MRTESAGSQSGGTAGENQGLETFQKGGTKKLICLLRNGPGGLIDPASIGQFDGLSNVVGKNYGVIVVVLRDNKGNRNATVDYHPR